MTLEFAQRMFDILRGKIGSEVSCKVWVYGKPMVFEGVLTGVDDFDKIILSTRVIPFVGTGQAIETIELTYPDGTKKVVFWNQKAVNYQITDPMGVVRAQQEMLGFSVKEVELFRNTAGMRRAI